MWLRLIGVAVGLWLMAAPWVFGYTGVWRTNDSIAGTLAVSAAIVAMSEVTRSARWINVAVGTWLLLAPMVLDLGAAPMWHRMLAGLLLLSTALVRGRSRAVIGGGWPALWSRGPFP